MSGRSRGNHLRRLLVALAVTLVSLLPGLSPVPPPAARAAFPSTVTWDGSAQFGPNWSIDFNWTGGHAPAFFADVVFDSTSVHDNMIDIQEYGINSLTILPGYTGAFSAIPGGGLVLLEGLTMSQPNEVILPFNIKADQNQTWQVPQIVGQLQVTGTVRLPSLLTVNSTGNTIFGGPVTGTSANNLLKTGTGTLRMTGPDPNTYLGFTSVTAGNLVLDKTNGPAVPGALLIGDTAGTDVVRLAKAQQIGDTSPVTINSAGRLDLGNQNETIGSLEGSGSVLLGSGTLTVGGNNSSTTFSGPISGTGGVTKVGTGTLQLTSSGSTYSGTTTISDGTLRLGGTLTGPVALTGGTLLGAAQLGPITATGGTISPGVGGGGGISSVLSATALDLAPGVVVKLGVNGSGPLDSDQVSVSGPVRLDGATLSLTTAVVPPAGTQFTLISQSGSAAVSGTFANLPQNATFLLPGPGGGQTAYRISYTGGNGNNVVLTALGPPCSPRPQVKVQSRASGGQLQVTVAASPLNFGMPNVLASLSFTRLDNASVVANGQGVTAGQTVQLAAGTASTTFSVSRATAGRPTTVQLTATDGCGEWKTFVGGGATAF